MSMVIGTNVASLTAQRHLATSRNRDGNLHGALILWQAYQFSNG